MNLFNETTNCDHCGLPPSPGENETLFNGFRDSDTGHLVCWSCRDIHYQQKWKTEHKGLYSEFPEMVNS